MKAFGEDGELLNAEFDVEETAAGFDLVLHSNGGVSRGKPPHNPDYIPALETILLRLAYMDASLEGVWVDSKEVAALDKSQRSISFSTVKLPVRLSNVADVGAFRLEIRRSVALIGGRGDGTPGTGNKKIRLALSFAPKPRLDELETALKGRSGYRRPSRYDPLNAWLRTVPGDVAKLGLDEIATMVGGLALESRHRHFWGTVRGRDVTRPQQRAWRDAGFKATLDESRREVAFRRIRPPTVATGYWIAVGKPTSVPGSEPSKDLSQWVPPEAMVRQIATGQLVAVRPSANSALPDQAESEEGVWIVEEVQAPGTPQGAKGGTPVLTVRRLATFAVGARRVGMMPELSLADDPWLEVSEDHFGAALHAWGLALDRLPVPFNSADLTDHRTRMKLWRRIRHAAPVVRERLSRYVERGQIGAMVKSANLFKCQICHAFGHVWEGFDKPDGTPYVEAHHVVAVATLDADVLSARNVITVCPNHHRQLHFGSVLTTDLGEEFEFRFPGRPPLLVPKFHERDVAEEP